VLHALVSTIRPFGNTVRRRFLSFVVIISSDSIVGHSGSSGMQPGGAVVRARCGFKPRPICPARIGDEMLYAGPSRDAKPQPVRSVRRGPRRAETPLRPAPRREALFGLDAEALAALMVGLGEPAWRGKQLAEALYRQRVSDLSEITTLSKLLRSKLASQGWEVGRPRIAQVFQSVDGTERYLVQCGSTARADAQTVETVWMPEGDDGEAGDGTDSASPQISGAPSFPHSPADRVGDREPRAGPSSVPISVRMNPPKAGVAPPSACPARWAAPSTASSASPQNSACSAT